MITVETLMMMITFENRMLMMMMMAFENLEMMAIESVMMMMMTITDMIFVTSSTSSASVKLYPNGVKSYVHFIQHFWEFYDIKPRMSGRSPLITVTQSLWSFFSSSE